jgi:glutathione S-transferase
MTTLTLHGPKQSSYMRSARWACAEKGVDHNVSPGGFDTLHPWSKIPVMTHGDVTLFETSAICRYIDEAFEGPRLMPADTVARAIAEQWVSALNCYGYDAIVRRFALKHFIIPTFRGDDPVLEGLAEATARLEHALDRFEAGFVGPWFTGSAFSLADIFLGPMLATASSVPAGKVVVNARPALATFLAAISERPAYMSIQPG